jgi:hypothetical protein
MVSFLTAKNAPRKKEKAVPILHRTPRIKRELILFKSTKKKAKTF